MANRRGTRKGYAARATMEVIMMPRDTQTCADQVNDSAGEARRFVSPQDFYGEAIQREDVRRILAALAKQSLRSRTARADDL